MAHGSHWTDAEADYVILHVGRRSPAAMARHLGRSEYAVIRWCAKHHLCPTRDEWLTSTWASRVTGLSPQYLTRLARQGRIKARRVPGGQWWLFDAAALPHRSA